jgi:exopolyphosphatase/guanosine-5'-triphosphate,3'-diphosphate pyrophosphatase
VRLTPTPTVVAAIDVGASAMRLIVAQHLPGQRPQVLEEASRGVLLGRDTFTAGRIGATTVDASVRALNAFRRMMDDYGVTRLRAVATSAVREAANADAFLDRIRVRTGITLEVIDGSEESRLTYLAVRDGLPATPR